MLCDAVTAVGVGPVWIFHIKSLKILAGEQVNLLSNLGMFHCFPCKRISYISPNKTENKIFQAFH